MGCVSSDVFPPAAENQSEGWKLKLMNPAMLRFGRPVLQPWNDLSGPGNRIIIIPLRSWPLSRNGRAAGCGRRM